MAVTAWKNPFSASSATWNNPTNVYTSDNNKAQSTTVGNKLLTGTYGGGFFGFFPASTGGKHKVINDIGVQIEANATGVGSPTCTLSARLSWDGGTSWTGTAQATWDTTEQYKPLAMFAVQRNQWAWGRKWTEAELAPVNFKIEINVVALGGPSPAANVDNIQARVTYTEVRHAGGGGGIIFNEERIVLMG